MYVHVCLYVVIATHCTQARHAQKVGAAGLIVSDNLEPVESDSPNKNPIPFSMSGDGIEDVTIPAVFMKKEDADTLRSLFKSEDSVYVLLTWLPEEKGEELKEEPEDSEDSPSAMSCDANSDSNSVKSGLYDTGMETLESNDQQQRPPQTCSGNSNSNYDSSGSAP